MNSTCPSSLSSTTTRSGPYGNSPSERMGTPIGSGVRARSLKVRGGSSAAILTEGRPGPSDVLSNPSTGSEPLDCPS